MSSSSTSSKGGIIDGGSSWIDVEIFWMISCTPIGPHSFVVGCVERREWNISYIKLFIYFYCMIYCIVYILDHVDHEDLPRNVFVCGTA